MLGKEAGANSNGSGSQFIEAQSNDGVSVRYNAIDASDLFKTLSASGVDSPMAKTVFRYLQGVRNSKGYRLTYRGMYPDE